MRAIELNSGLIITLPLAAKSKFLKKFDTQNMQINSDGNIVWNRHKGLRYEWHLYFNGISQNEINNIKKIYEASTTGTLKYYPDSTNLCMYYEVLIDNPYAFHEIFRKGSGKWSGEIKLITQDLIDENIYYSDDFDTDAADCNEFNTIYPPKLTLLNCSTSIRNAIVTDSILKIWAANGELAWVKMPLKNYPYGVLDLQILRTKVSISSGRSTGVQISPLPGYMIELSIQNSGTHWSIGGAIQYPGYYDHETKTIDGYVAGTTEMDLRIQSSDLRTFSLQHRLDGDWVEDFLYTFPEEWEFTEDACLKLYTMWGWIELDKLQFTPNGVYIP